MSKRKLDPFDGFRKAEERNIQKSIKYYSKEIEFWKESFNMLHDAFKSIARSYSERWSYSKKAGCFILPRLIMSTKTSLELLIRGYYFDHNVIGRSLWESTALLALFSKDEEAAKKWLNFEKLELPKWKLVREIHPSPTKEMLALSNKAYAEVSHFVHSSFAAIISDLSTALNRKKGYLEFPKFDKRLIREAINAPLSLMILLTLKDIYKDELEKSFKTKITNFITKKVSEWEAEDL